MKGKRNEQLQVHQSTKTIFAQNISDRCKGCLGGQKKWIHPFVAAGPASPSVGCHCRWSWLRWLSVPTSWQCETMKPTFNSQAVDMSMTPLMLGSGTELPPLVSHMTRRENRPLHSGLCSWTRTLNRLMKWALTYEIFNLGWVYWDVIPLYIKKHPYFKQCLKTGHGLAIRRKNVFHTEKMFFSYMEQVWLSHLERFTSLDEVTLCDNMIR